MKLEELKEWFEEGAYLSMVGEEGPRLEEWTTRYNTWSLQSVNRVSLATRLDPIPANGNWQGMNSLAGMADAFFLGTHMQLIVWGGLTEKSGLTEEDIKRQCADRIPAYRAALERIETIRERIARA